MASYVDLGGQESGCLNVLPLSVDRALSDSVVVKNVAGSTVSYATTTGAQSGTIAASSSATFTTPAWLTSAASGRSSLMITGGKY